MVLAGVCATVVLDGCGCGGLCTRGEETRTGKKEKVRGIGEGGNTGKWGVCVSVCSGNKTCREEMGGELEMNEERNEGEGSGLCVCVWKWKWGVSVRVWKGKKY
ncbi:hypothetical protein C1H46_040971 [Malus baccata]|uniref:Uncharacterized protein n=1 Tax=Malus baccata TaxID=106549 RepID=A0A540KH56_MALBA|nr:hypothetical protein C1H46_040971 [Malus baccata]